jgi:tetraacyldisaccharide 4'-kinase
VVAVSLKNRAGVHASDEIAEFAECLPEEVGLEYAARKVDAALRAAEAGAEFIVIDDGFSHRSLARDIDLVLLDAREPLGNGHLLPAGALRERPSALARADAVVLSRADRASASEREEARRLVRSLGFSGPILEARHRTVGVREDGEVRPVGERRVFCASGLGRPQELAEAARLAGLEVVGERSFGDHHRFRETEWQELKRTARSQSAALLVSHKDVVRLPDPLRREALVLEVEWEWLEGEVDPSWLVERLLRARAR